ncbi:hypothetical protein [Kitasatospora sp. NPDC018619]|uniref:hypothetical protein n=1 Tax=unclassified Kitasatospora TaxID=2633591 RepID=UPI0037A40C1C
MNRHTSINRALATTAVALGAALSLGVGPAVAATDASGWGQLPLAPKGSITKMAAVGTDTVFASTQWDCSMSGESWTCGQTWQLKGTTWSQFKLPAQLSGTPTVAGTGAGDTWFLGSGTAAQAFHWDGTAWVDRSPSPAVAGYDARDAVALSATSAWSVGTTTTNYDHRTDTATVGRWNGTRWTVSKLPAPTGRTTTLNSVSAAAENDVWASGEQCRDTGNDRCQPYLAHWDGTAWSQVAVPDSSPRSLTNTRVVSRGGEVFVGGRETDLTTRTQPDRIVALHWDGAAWTRSVLPVTVSADGWYSYLNGLVYRGTEVFAAVSHTANEGVLRWNGQAWEPYAGPLTTTPTVTALVPTVDGRVLAAGNGTDASGAHDFLSYLPATAPVK